ncbi:DUF1566 domain-containing protein [Acinetobacter sp.]|uniref:Lcl C-terminal domain-containing protein n=1 Tax=Acinetobacter sp. TaxID=472 RepID=UPI00388E2C46
MNNLLSDFFVSNTELKAIDYFLEAMAKTNISDEKIEILKKQNIEQQKEINQLKNQLKKPQRDQSFCAEKMLLNPSSLIKQDNSQDELSTGVWTDTQTGLMWGRICIGQEWVNGARHGKAHWVHWRSAEILCRELTLGGYFDWRLPEIEELKTLLRDSIRPWWGSKNIKGDYWSNTVNETYSGFVHTISFDRSCTASHPYSAKAYIIPVRNIR